jgi:glucokinase
MEKDKKLHKFFPVLITDIGGTNSRMRIIKVSSDAEDEPVEIDYKKLKSQDYKSLEEVCLEYLKPFVGTENYPVLAVIALPGPIINNNCDITANLTNWGTSNGDLIAKSLGIKNVYLLNDFQVNGYGVMSSQIKINKDYFIINGEEGKYPNEPLAIIGPGTGLGHGIAVKSRTDKYHSVYSSEGGHSVFLAHTDREWRFRNYLSKKFNVSHVSHERAVAGPGIIYMFNFLIDEENLECSLLDKNDSEFEKKRWELKAEDIVTAANQGSCPVAVEVRKMFIELLATACSNFVLTVVPLNGLYIVGSISNSFQEFIKNDPTFMNRFLDKGRLKDFLKNFPIYLVVHPQIGLLGSEEFARRVIERKLEHGEF